MSGQEERPSSVLGTREEPQGPENSEPNNGHDDSFSRIFGVSCTPSSPALQTTSGDDDGRSSSSTNETTTRLTREQSRDIVNRLLSPQRARVGRQSSLSMSSSSSSSSELSFPLSTSQKRSRSWIEETRQEEKWGRQGMYEGMNCVVDESRMRVRLGQQIGDNFVRLRRGRRGLGLGSSDIGVVCGIGKALPRHLWQHILDTQRRREEGTLVEDEGNPMTRHGHRFERLAKRVYEIITGNLCHSGGVWRIFLEDATRWDSVSPSDPWDFLGCSPDACILFDSPQVPASLSLLKQDPCNLQLVANAERDQTLSLPFRSPPSSSLSSSAPSLSLDRRQSLPKMMGFDQLRCGVEFKCPVFAMYKDIPKHYMAQMQYQAWAMRVPYVDFCAVLVRPRDVAFTKKEPDTMIYDSLTDTDFVLEEVMVARVYRNERFISWMMDRVRQFSSCLWHKTVPTWGWEESPPDATCRVEILLKGSLGQEEPLIMRDPSSFTVQWPHLSDLSSLLVRWSLLRSLSDDLPVSSSSDSPQW